ncbi:hypothetical protein CR513_17451, partial [Mucuna pruriens]
MENQERREVSLFRANMLESNDITIARFLNELNKDLQYVEELYLYTSMDALEDETMENESSRHESSSINETNLSSELSLDDKDLLTVRHLMSIQIGGDDDS